MSQTITWAVDDTILDDYVIERELGRGGMGCVWLVKSKSTGRPFAVKQTLIKDDRHRKAFLTELQTWIDLPEHPNIVPCRFFRTVGDEIVIFADYIAGGSLAEWIARRKLTKLEQILDVAIQFAWGLHAVHERGLIHQDVKPGNVLMTAEGVPLVTDFGLARARLRASDGQFVSPVVNLGQDSVLISAGGMTPAYASPEQVAGQPLSRKTDIWSWGVSVLDMFMGGVSCPHGGHIAAEVLEGFIENGQMEDGLPEMPKDVADILRKCFTRDPAERWGSLDESVQAMMDAFQSATGRKYKRQLCHAAERQAQVVQYDRRAAMGVQWRDPREWLREAYVAVGRDLIEAESYQPPPAYSRKGTGVADLAVYEEAERLFLQAIESGRTDARESLAWLYGNKALLCSSLDDATGTLRAFDQCIAIRTRLVEQEGRRELIDDLAMALHNKAVAMHSMRDTAGAVRVYDQCIAIYKRLVEQEGRLELANGLASALMNKASAIYFMGDLIGTVALTDQCIAIYKRLVEHEGRRDLANGLASALMNKALAVGAMGDLAGAVALYDQCIAIQRRLVEQEGRRELATDLAKALMNKANGIKNMGDLAGSVTLYDECIAIRRRLVEQEGRRELADGLAMALMGKATAVYFMGDLAGAVKLYDECIEIQRRLVEQEGRRELASGLAGALLNKAVAVKAMGNLAGTVTLYDEIIKIYTRLVEQEGRRELAKDLALALQNKANTLYSTGDLAGAIACIDQGIAIQRYLVEQESRCELAGDLAWAQLVRARMLLAIGNVPPAEVINAKKAFAVLMKEVQRTGRADLLRVLKGAQANLADIL